MTRLWLSIWLVLFASRTLPASGWVSLAPSLTDIVVAIGAADSLAAVSRYCRLPDSLDLPRVGAYHDPDLEALILLKPSGLLLANPMPELEERLVQLKIPCLRFPQDRITEIIGSVSRLGALLNHEAEAAVLVRNLEAPNQSAPCEGELPRVLIVASRASEAGPPSQIWCIGRGSWLSELLQAACAQNALADSRPALPLVSREGLMQIDPDLIIELWPEDFTLRDSLALVNDWQAWPELGAVRNGRVHIFKRRELQVPGPDLPVALALIKRTLQLEAR
jgi:ABC-type Fe3+-hydroxamate transport system substrate-binding protein